MLHTVEDYVVHILSLIGLSLGVDFHMGYYRLPINEITTNSKEIQKLGPSQVHWGLRDLVAQPIMLLKQLQF